MHNKTLETDAGFSGKHFAKMKSEILATEACGSAWRCAARVLLRALRHLGRMAG
jgi:hypothetical protein